MINGLVKLFDVPGTVVSAEHYGAGHINDTYRIATIAEGERRIDYILQRINHHIFRDVEGLMNNIVGVTEYIVKALEAAGEDSSRAMRVIRAKDTGLPYVRSAEGNYYRMYNFIPDAVSIETTATPHQFCLSGAGFGRFQKLLDGYDATKLTESIPFFHDTTVRLKNLERAVEDDVAGRRKDVAPEIDFFLSRAAYADRIVSKLKSGVIPYRVTHNDTKLNNVLIDMVEDRAVTVVDLDTVMPGSIVYDFGDSIRSGANLGAEDEKDLGKVAFSIDLFEAFCKGFLGEVGKKLVPAEIEEMAFGAILMTYECGMRFLTDHLNGDTYFKIHREGHNLDRARTQIKMVKDMEGALDRMNAIVRKYC